MSYVGIEASDTWWLPGAGWVHGPERAPYRPGCLDDRKFQGWLKVYLYVVLATNLPLHVGEPRDPSFFFGGGVTTDCVIRLNAITTNVDDEHHVCGL